MKSLIAIVLLALAGCTTPLESARASLAAAPNCCRTMSEFRYEALSAGDTRRFKLVAGSSAARFDTGKSYFRAFVLPPSARGYSVRIQSFMEGEDVHSAYLFFPHVLTLDDWHRVVRTLAPEAFKLKHAGFVELSKETWWLPWKLEATMRFGKENAAERYLVVLTTDALLARNTSIEARPSYVPIMQPPGAGTVGAVLLAADLASNLLSSSTKEWVTVPYAPAGHLCIAITE